MNTIKEWIEIDFTDVNGRKNLIRFFTTMSRMKEMSTK